MACARSQRGFTLIEVMITVAIIAVLAVLVVPSFIKESRKTKHASEVGAVFGELAIRQDQYKLENGVYLAATGCPGSTSPTGADASGCIASGGVWENLRVRLPSTNLLCDYVITTGSGTGTTNPSGFTFSSPSGEWYYIIATCDGDGVTATNATYFVSSLNQTIQKQNEGR
jgi:prepilin-type N-terminal cleavage/methylation domain-containing protein